MNIVSILESHARSIDDPLNAIVDAWILGVEPDERTLLDASVELTRRGWYVEPGTGEPPTPDDTYWAHPSMPEMRYTILRACEHELGM